MTMADRIVIMKDGVVQQVGKPMELYEHPVNKHAVLEKGLETLSEKDLFEMLQLANAAASLITTRKGALRVMPKYEEITALIEDK